MSLLLGGCDWSLSQCLVVGDNDEDLVDKRLDGPQYYGAEGIMGSMQPHVLQRSTRTFDSAFVLLQMLLSRCPNPQSGQILVVVVRESVPAGDSGICLAFLWLYIRALVVQLTCNVWSLGHIYRSYGCMHRPRYCTYQQTVFPNSPPQLESKETLGKPRMYQTCQEHQVLDEGARKASTYGCAHPRTCCCSIETVGNHATKLSQTPDIHIFSSYCPHCVLTSFISLLH